MQNIPAVPTTRTVTDDYGNQHVIPGPFASVDEIRRANARIDNYWFDPTTLRFFNSRISDVLYAGRIFISSERHVYEPAGISEPRLYTIRVASDRGEVFSLSEFQEFASSAQAKAAILRMLQ